MKEDFRIVSICGILSLGIYKISESRVFATIAYRPLFLVQPEGQAIVLSPPSYRILFYYLSLAFLINGSIQVIVAVWIQ